MQYFKKNDKELIYSSFKKGNNTVIIETQSKSNNDIIKNKCFVLVQQGQKNNMSI